MSPFVCCSSLSVGVALSGGCRCFLSLCDVLVLFVGGVPVFCVWACVFLRIGLLHLALCCYSWVSLFCCTHVFVVVAKLVVACVACGLDC